MKLKTENRKKLSAVRKALLIGIPVSGLSIAAGIVCMMPELNAGPQNKQKMQEKEEFKDVTVDPMSFFLRSFATPGMFYPPPVKFHCRRYAAQEGDTWEALAEKNKTTVEVLLRVNGVSAERFRKIFRANEIPADLKLKKGKVIYIPVEMEGEVWGPCYVYGSPDKSDKGIRFVLLAEDPEKQTNVKKESKK